jgi:hypothetical protein
MTGPTNDMPLPGFGQRAAAQPPKAGKGSRGGKKGATGATKRPAPAPAQPKGKGRGGRRGR